MPDLSFDLNLGSLFSPLLLVVLAWVAHGVQKRIMVHFDAKHAENTERLERIEIQTLKTNGRVDALETEHKTDHDTLLALKGAVEALLKIRGEPP